MSYLGELRRLVGHRPLLSAGAAVLVIKDGESLRLKYYDINALPELESRARVIADWLRDNRPEFFK